MRHLLTIDDLTQEEIRSILTRARQLESGAETSHNMFVVALLFLSSSLRTRVGYAAAALRLGASTIEVMEPRFAKGMSSAESFEDTLRSVSGMVELVVCRAETPLAHGLIDDHCACPMINGGDTSGHPTQALIDVCAIESELGTVGNLTIAMCGDLTQRSARSLLQLFGRMLPKKLVLVSPPQRSDHGVHLAKALADRTEERLPEELSNVDVLYMTGFAPGVGPNRVSDSVRLAYALTFDRISTLPTDAIVLCPLPAIDEIAPDARQDGRIRMWAQSDRGVFVRMALLEMVRQWI